MNSVIIKMLRDIESNSPEVYEKIFSDLKYVIERFSMSRYSEKEKADYLKEFYNKDLIDFRLTAEDFTVVRYFLFYTLFNSPSKAPLAAKCIKVLFDESSVEAICNAIELYYMKDDDTTTELIYSLINQDEYRSRLTNKRIMGIFRKVFQSGRAQSREAVRGDLE